MSEGLPGEEIMSKNWIGPMWAKLRYDVGGMLHTMTVSIRRSNLEGDPVPGYDPTLKDRGGVSMAAKTALTAFANAVSCNQNSAVAWMGYDVFFQDIPNLPGQFIYSGTIEDVYGKRTDPVTHPAMQTTITYRSSTGGRFRSTVFGGIASHDVVIAGGALGDNVAFAAWDAYLRSGESVVVARDGGYPAGAIRATTKINNAIRRKVLGL